MTSQPSKRRKVSSSSASVHAHDHEHDYSALLIGVRASFACRAGDTSHLFETDADGLNDLYLDTLPAERQVHNCFCCRRFIFNYGGLVTIGKDGDLWPVMWLPAGIPEFYRKTFDALYARVRRARVTGVFLAKEKVWGTPRTGTWTHLSIEPPSDLVYCGRALTAGQAMAASRENFRTVTTALSEFNAKMLDEGLRLLRAESLQRSEKFIGPMQWLRDLQDRPKGRHGENVLWRAIASAPEGYCHPRSSVIGPLLEDIAAGLPFKDIKARFDAKMAPLQYQRPQAAPKAGNIVAAGKLVEKLGIEPSLERRYARLDELDTLWTPHERRREPAPTGGVFGAVKARGGAPSQTPVNLPVSTLTWEKFARTVLQSAEQIEFQVPWTGRFIALTTAVHANAPPVLKWDHEDERNPVAWYVYPTGSNAGDWKLRGSTWAKINAICLLPTLWGTRPMPHLSEGAVLILDGCVDTRDAGNGLFPECLKDDLHGARATIEAYSKSAKLSARRDASACGYDIRRSAADCSLRVFANGAWTRYDIDRWD